MITVTYITRPFFNDIALELIQELKKKSELNVIIIVSSWTIEYFEIHNSIMSAPGKSSKLTDEILDIMYTRYRSYFVGANVIFRYEEVKETSFKNTLSWMKLLSTNENILNSDLTITESLSLADVYFLFKIRNKKHYHIVHDPVPHSGERRWRMELMRNVYFKDVDKFLLYSSYSTDLFKSAFTQYTDKTITLKTPIYYNKKTSVTKMSKSAKRKVLFFGRISLYKGVDLFYSAAELLSKEFDDVLFIIADKSRIGYSPKFLEDNSNANIHIINKFIDSNTLSLLMEDSSYCVLPYLDATQSGVIMTCYAYTLPVLVSDCPGLLEYVFDQENFSFRNRDINDLIFKMRNLLSNENLLVRYKESIVNYSAQNISSNNVLELLKTI